MDLAAQAGWRGVGLLEAPLNPVMLSVKDLLSHFGGGVDFT